MYYLALRFPALLPVGMVLFNVFNFSVALMSTGRFREGPLRYAVMYAMTVRPALQGDLQPFFIVLRS